jgi:cyclohexanone monooxygenase
VERGGDVGGTWYWNRYPGAACDVSAYDYLPLLDELNHVPKSFFAKGPEIFVHCQAIAPEIQSLRTRGVPDHGHLHRLE